MCAALDIDYTVVVKTYIFSTYRIIWIKMKVGIMTLKWHKQYTGRCEMHFMFATSGVRRVETRQPQCMDTWGGVLCIFSWTTFFRILDTELKLFSPLRSKQFSVWHGNTISISMRWIFVSRVNWWFISSINFNIDNLQNWVIKVNSIIIGSVYVDNICELKEGESRSCRMMRHIFDFKNFSWN